MGWRCPGGFWPNHVMMEPFSERLERKLHIERRRPSPAASNSTRTSPSHANARQAHQNTSPIQQGALTSPPRENQSPQTFSQPKFSPPPAPSFDQYSSSWHPHSFDGHSYESCAMEVCEEDEIDSELSFIVGKVHVNDSEPADSMPYIS
eukprot:TRINITY_DN5365_c0_g1_i2.p1 TRINITY_DN5365_c0_g1~~TRINITY_DN5365_c0_g1_i2.p1  ORF type:complete len:149 (+),score=18.63 TRINITY_DN5365_c0_g1_i2:2-448(+)